MEVANQLSDRARMQTNLNQFFNSGVPLKAAVSRDDGS